ncbi:MAG: carboxylesterase/lipase family protein [Bacteroidales bacterium]|nr:carboxylesterase/lipase family protein [Bacteroidales bacterium]MBQ9172632.1 carboxylesterase/lipase family protein [Bacteroidales bacterium]MBQ9711883.1 carboxylesterase/lipase family protein [Bacteroidales bacterium]
MLMYKSRYRLLFLAVLSAGIVSCSGSSQKKDYWTDLDSQQLYIGEDIAVAPTSYGKVRGYILRNVYTFLGIPYGAPASGENRFRAPQPPEPWEGVLPTVYYGDSAPQRTEGKYRNTDQTFADHWNYDDVSEDCLRLNVWTPGLDGNKRPVLVWIHGGGFTSGNGIEQDGYNGENISRYGDIVFVSLNHRLGPIGFSDFSSVDPKYADSGNAGILDIVAALKWVQENISSFGGDPSNVTIMGQSGGGAKVCTLVAMAQTGGLFSKAVALSGNITGAIDSNYSSGLGEYIAKKAGGMQKLIDMPWREYLDFADACAREYNVDHSNGMMRGAFGPVGDGFNIPMKTFYSDKNCSSNNIPMIFCATSGELSGSERMRPAVTAKASQDAPVYLACFGFNPPLFDGKKGAFHCLDICFWFRNTDLMLTHTGGGARPRALADKMSDALLAFMRTGDPNIAGLPQWPRYTQSEGATMYLDDECRVINAPDAETLKGALSIQ